MVVQTSMEIKTDLANYFIQPQRIKHQIVQL